MNNQRLQILYGLFIALLVGMNLLGGKIVELFGVSVSVAIFMAPLTFLITDIVEEVYGRQAIKYFIKGGIISLIFIFAFTGLFVYMEPHPRFTFDESYRKVFGSSMRILVASIVAFWLSQMHDAVAFDFWKKKTGGKMLWLRNNLSTIVSQMIDTAVFMFIAFYQVTPQFTASFLVELGVPYYLFKVFFAILDTPLVYLGVYWLRGGGDNGREQTDKNSFFNAGVLSE